MHHFIFYRLIPFNCHFIAFLPPPVSIEPKNLAENVLNGDLAPDNVVDFGVPLFNVDGFPSHLYIRRSFASLAEHILKEWKARMVEKSLESYGAPVDENELNGKVKKALEVMGSTTTNEEIQEYKICQIGVTITGNPGVGKTSFIAYLALVCYSARIPFQYYGAVERGTGLTGSAAIDEHGYISSEFLRSKLCISVYHHDPPGGESRGEMGYLVFLTSPDEERMKRFGQRVDDPTYMPVWSFREIEMCRANCFEDVPQKTVMCLFNIFGGIARYVLARARIKHSNLNLTTENVVNSLVRGCIKSKMERLNKPQDVLQLMEKVAAFKARKESHALFHYRRPERRTSHFPRMK